MATPLRESVTWSSTEVEPPSCVRRFTVDEYHRMIANGILGENDRVELLEGWIVEMSPHGPAWRFIWHEIKSMPCYRRVGKQRPRFRCKHPRANRSPIWPWCKVPVDVTSIITQPARKWRWSLKSPTRRLKRTAFANVVSMQPRGSMRIGSSTSWSDRSKSTVSPVHRLSPRTISAMKNAERIFRTSKSLWSSQVNPRPRSLLTNCCRRTGRAIRTGTSAAVTAAELAEDFAAPNS